MSSGQQIQCNECKATLKVPDTVLGKRVRCPRCKTNFLAVEAEVTECEVIDQPTQEQASTESTTTSDIQIDCPGCKKGLSFAAGLAGVSVNCPHKNCGVWFDLPEDEDVAGEESADTDEADWGSAPRKARRRNEKAEKKVARKRKQANRVRREGLRQVYIGLQVHSAALLVFLVGLACAAFTCGALLPLTVILTAVASAVNLPFPILCMKGPRLPAHWTLLASIGLSIPPMLLAVAFFLIGMTTEIPPLALIVIALVLPALTFMASHVLWLIYIRDLSDYLERKELGEAAMDLLSLEGKFFLIVCPFMGMLVFVTLLFPRMGLMAAGSLAAFFISTTDMHWWEVLLYPTGIPLVIKYYDLLASVRYIIQRYI